MARLRRIALLSFVAATSLTILAGCPDKKADVKDSKGHDHKEGDGHDHKDGDGHTTGGAQK